MKEAKIADEVVVVSVGPKQSAETLRTALAMGADRGIHILTDARTDQEIAPLAVAKILEQVVKKETPDMVIVGKQAIDDDSNCTGQMLSYLLDWPQHTYASEIVVDGTSVVVTREIDGGLQKLTSPLPAVVTADLRLNEPRYATLPNIMKAKKKKIETMAPDDLGVSIDNNLKIINVADPPVRAGGVKVESVDELIEKLKNEAGVL